MTGLLTSLFVIGAIAYCVVKMINKKKWGR